MSQKDRLIEHLEHVIQNIKLADGDDFSLRRMRELYFYPFADPDTERQLHRLHEKMDHLLKRPTLACRMASDEGDGVMRMMTNVGVLGRAQAIHHLRVGFGGAKQLTICDPYFLLSNSKISKQEYLAGIDTVIPSTVKNIELYVKPRKRDAEVASGFTSLCQQRGIKLVCRKTDEIHDRVWITDSTRAFVVGASFNGLGNKCAFILELPEEDRRNFISEVGLLRERTTRSKSA
jgi:hypothetical protein